MQDFVKEFELHQAENTRNRERVHKINRNYTIIFWTHIVMALLFAAWSFGAALIVGNSVTGVDKFFKGMNAGAFQFMYVILSIILAFLLGSKFRAASYISFGAYGFLTFYTLLHLSAAGIPNFLISIVGIGMSIWALMNNSELEELKKLPGYPSFHDRLNTPEYTAPAYVTQKQASDNMDAITNDGIITPAAPKPAVMDTVSIPAQQEVLTEFALPQGNTMVQPPQPASSVADFREELSAFSSTETAQQSQMNVPTEPAPHSDAFLESLIDGPKRYQYAPHPEMLDSPEEVRERLRKMRDFREES